MVCSAITVTASSVMLLFYGPIWKEAIHNTIQPVVTFVDQLVLATQLAVTAAWLTSLYRIDADKLKVHHTLKLPRFHKNMSRENEKLNFEQNIIVIYITS